MDEKYIELAINLAEKGRGSVSPNPLVGAVIVKENKVIGKGYHEKFGGMHAEINALNNTNESVFGATMYVNLEPCSHFGKTPPCVDKIIESGISKVVIGMKDPNPLVSGKGIEKLIKSGIDVTVGVLEEKCKRLNEIFIKYITYKVPFVVMKFAMSLDGKISTYTGDSKWISSEISRKKVHILRNNLSGIMVGINTVIKDNPKLTCRLENGKNPVRIIVDSTLKIPLVSNVIQDKKAKTIIATTNKASIEKINYLQNIGIKILITKEKNGKVDLEELMIKLGELGIDSILLEGGGELNFSVLSLNLVDKVEAFISPKLIGGKDSKTPVEGKGVEKIHNAFNLKNTTVDILDEDILIKGYIGREKCLQE